MAEDQVIEFTAPVSGMGRGGHAIRIPADVRAVFGQARPPVVVVADHQLEFRTTIAVYGKDSYVGLRKEQLAELGAEAGSEVHVTVRLDVEPRTVQPPGELLLALAAEPAVSELFEQMSYSHQREYAQWVAAAKQSETRQRRAGKVIEMIREGQRP